MAPRSALATEANMPSRRSRSPYPSTACPITLNKHLNKQKEFIQGLMELLKESLDDMPAELNQQGELTAGLVMLLKKSIASEKKAPVKSCDLRRTRRSSATRLTC